MHLTGGEAAPLQALPTPEVDSVPTSVGSSLTLDGSGDYLTSPNLTLGTGDFTVECWIYLTAATGTRIICSRATGGGATGTWSFSISPTTIAFTEVVAGEPGPSATISTIINTWAHVAAARASSTTKLFVNGLQVASASQTTDFSNTSYLVYVGTSPSETYVQGYIYDLRMSRYAKYTQPFVPSRTIVPATGLTTYSISPTTVGIYDSAGQRGFSTEGDGKLSVAQKKYGSTSMYFDGTGDYLYLPTGSANFLSQCTTNWTIECWAYYTAVSPMEIISTASASSTTGILLTLNYSSLNEIDMQIFRGSAGNFYTVKTGSSVLTPNAWNHIAITFTVSGTAFNMYVNGVKQTLTTTGTATFSSGAATNQPTVGCYAPVGGYYFNGYISNLRLVNGSVLYTSSFVPPTAPPTSTAAR